MKRSNTIIRTTLFLMLFFASTGAIPLVDCNIYIGSYIDEDKDEIWMLSLTHNKTFKFEADGHAEVYYFDYEDCDEDYRTTTLCTSNYDTKLVFRNIGNLNCATSGNGLCQDSQEKYTDILFVQSGNDIFHFTPKCN